MKNGCKLQTLSHHQSDCRVREQINYVLRFNITFVPEFQYSISFSASKELEIIMFVYCCNMSIYRHLIHVWGSNELCGSLDKSTVFWLAGLDSPHKVSKNFVFIYCTHRRDHRFSFIMCLMCNNASLQLLFRSKLGNAKLTHSLLGSIVYATFSLSLSTCCCTTSQYLRMNRFQRLLSLDRY